MTAAKKAFDNLRQRDGAPPLNVERFIYLRRQGLTWDQRDPLDPQGPHFLEALVRCAFTSEDWPRYGWMIIQLAKRVLAHTSAVSPLNEDPLAWLTLAYIGLGTDIVTEPLSQSIERWLSPDLPEAVWSQRCATMHELLGQVGTQGSFQTWSRLWAASAGRPWEAEPRLTPDPTVSAFDASWRRALRTCETEAAWLARRIDEALAHVPRLPSHAMASYRPLDLMPWGPRVPALFGSPVWRQSVERCVHQCLASFDEGPVTVPRILGTAMASLWWALAPDEALRRAPAPLVETWAWVERHPSLLVAPWDPLSQGLHDQAKARFAGHRMDQTWPSRPSPGAGAPRL